MLVLKNPPCGSARDAHFPRMPIDLQKWRADTPAAEAGRIHLNNAGAALMPRPVADAITKHLKLENSLGGYEAEAAAREDLEATYEAIATLIGARARNIAVVEMRRLRFRRPCRPSISIRATFFSPRAPITSPIN
jgi:hypothetical protein